MHGISVNVANLFYDLWNQFSHSKTHTLSCVLMYFPSKIFLVYPSSLAFHVILLSYNIYTHIHVRVMWKKENEMVRQHSHEKKVLKYFSLPSASCKSNIDDKIIWCGEHRESAILHITYMQNNTRSTTATFMAPIDAKWVWY